VGEACDTCKLRVGSLSFSLAPPGIVLSEVHFEQGDPRDSAVLLEAMKAEIPISLSSLFGDTKKIGLVRFTGVDVTVHEGDLLLPKKAKDKQGEGAKFECAGVEISTASFSYRKDSGAGAAWIRLPDVTAQIGAFGSYGDWLNKKITGTAEAQLEKSGQVKIMAETLIGVEGPWANVDLRVGKLNLSEMNPYFRPEEGVSMKGRLLESHGKVEVRNLEASGFVEARYEGLDLTFHPNRHRGGLSAILTNLGVAIKMNKGNSGEPRSERKSAVVTKRHKKESVVGFILRTLKEAMLRVAT
jgi:hypothetical protein